jgi:hypothetical protein
MKNQKKSDMGINPKMGNEFFLFLEMLEMSAVTMDTIRKISADARDFFKSIGFPNVDVSFHPHYKPRKKKNKSSVKIEIHSQFDRERRKFYGL